MSEYASHKACEHPNTQFNRWKCRAQRRHAGCDHKQNVSQWRACENATRAKVREG